MFVCLSLASAASFRMLGTDVPLPTTALPPPGRNVHIIQRIINGLAEEVNVEPPAINACVDESASRSYVRLITQILNQLSLKDWVGLPKTVERIKEGFPQKSRQCLVDDANMKALWDAYGVTDLGWINLYLKLSEYAKDGNYDVIMQNLTDINTLYQKGQYENAGKLLGQVIINVVVYNPDTAPPSPFKLLKSIKSRLLYNEGDNSQNDDGSTYNNYGNQNYNTYYNDVKEEADESTPENFKDHYDNYNHYDITINNNGNEDQPRNNNRNNGNQNGYNDEGNGSNTYGYNNRDNNNNNERENNNGGYNNLNSNNGQNYPSQEQLRGGNSYYQNNNAYDQVNDNTKGEQYQDYGNGNNYSNQGSGDRGNQENDDPAPQLVYTIFRGAAGFVGQREPASLQQCLDPKSGRIILDFLLNAIGEINDQGFDRLRPTLDGFLNVVPQSSLRCISESQDFAHLLRAYNVREENLQNFFNKIAQYAESDNLKELTQKALQILISADKEDFDGLGQNTGRLLKLVFN